MKIALCTIARLENRYIREYIRYYHDVIQVDHIYLYDNNDIDGEDLSEPIKDYIQEGFVDLIDYRIGHKFVQVVLDAYADCYERHENEYDWICFFDPDEYLVVNDCNGSLKDYLATDRFTGYDVIHVNWMTYDDNNMLSDDGRDLNERFTHASELSSCYKENCQTKSIIRGGIGVREFPTPHRPVINDDNLHKSCNASGVRTPNLHTWPVIDYANMYLKHFRCKTITEYCENKIPKLTLAGYTKVNFDDQFFFRINEWTQEKQDIFDGFIDRYCAKDYNQEFRQPEYTVITVVTGNDNQNQLNEIINPDPQTRYICVTDNIELKSDTWEIIYDKRLNRMEQIERWKYPKFHPFEYAETEWAVYADSSLVIRNDMVPVIDHMKNNDYELGLVVHNQRGNVETEIDQWVRTRNFPFEKAYQIKKFYEDQKYSSSTLFWCCMMIMRNCDDVNRINQMEFDLLRRFGDNNDVCRTDQVFYPYAVNSVINGNKLDKVILFHPNILCSKYIQRIKIDDKGKRHSYNGMLTDKFVCFDKMIKPLKI